MPSFAISAGMSIQTYSISVVNWCIPVKPSEMPMQKFRQLALVVVTTLSLQVVSLQFAEKYLLWPGFVTAAILFPLSFLAYRYLLLSGSPLLRAQLLLPLLFFGMAALVEGFIYPHADALRAEMRGSDRDDCVRIVVNQLISGHLGFYGTYSYFGSPCSTGFGEAVLYLPFAFIGLLPYAPIFLLGASYRLMTRSSMSTERSFFVALMGSTLITWYELAVGSDFLFIGAAALLAMLALEHANGTEGHFGWLVLAVIVSGLTASSRVALLYLPSVYALILVKQNPLTSLYFFCGSMLIAAACTFFPYVLSPHEFTPLHVLGKGATLLKPHIVMVVVVVIGAGLSLLWLAVSGGIQYGRLMLAIALGIPMTLVALADAQAGVSTIYLAIAVPPFCAWVARACSDFAAPRTPPQLSSGIGPTQAP